MFGCVIFKTFAWTNKCSRLFFLSLAARRKRGRGQDADIQPGPRLRTDRRRRRGQPGFHQELREHHGGPAQRAQRVLRRGAQRGAGPAGQQLSPPAPHVRLIYLRLWRRCRVPDHEQSSVSEDPSANFFFPLSRAPQEPWTGEEVNE